ncbi:MAG: D-glycero-beta-D-manno-heptose 1,7-bisphosphate 7-phosphatase [Gammaproteobacteria bacterium]|nr:D-glycero-beta-D-manno-heptose 1,7-bisphosphate 7-phosphatase [Gammaproteobacteria bacterium]
MSARTKLVLLDRDGVINVQPPNGEYVTSANEWSAIPGSLEAIARLNRAGYRVVVATNQSGVGRGLFDVETLHQIHEKMHRQLVEYGGHIDAIFYCPHHPDDGCSCRKPLPGMLHEAAERLHCSLAGVPYVGDSARDLEAAAAAGADPVLVETGNGSQTLSDLTKAARTPPSVYADLAGMVDAFLSPTP